ncbi:hypothetical protein [Streptomyces sp. cg35]|uniref:hypothetical protein n=1 Tax=Streptomyces sp. cg35 TaxID=3421650 RepID=UPI003D17FAA2
MTDVLGGLIWLAAGALFVWTGRVRMLRGQQARKTVMDAWMHALQQRQYLIPSDAEEMWHQVDAAWTTRARLLTMAFSAGGGVCIGMGLSMLSEAVYR